MGSERSGNASASGVAYFVFDVESVADGDLVAKVKYPGETLSPEDAVTQYRAQLLEESNSDFIPYTFQIPISIVVAKLDKDFQLVDLVSLDEPQYRSHEMTRLFWTGWEAYRFPTLVTFNGRVFDIPLLELAAFRYGLSVPAWFNATSKTYDQRRNRYNQSSHLDLYDVLTNFGASRFSGGLDLAANLIGKPGKLEIKGHMVQDMYHAGELKEISNYCRCDVLDTYFVMLRSLVLMGRLSLDREKELVESTRQWLEARSKNMPAYRNYLSQWGDWQNPW